MTLKVISLNMWQGGNLYGEIIKFVKEQDPDVLCLQEVYDGQDPNLEYKYQSLEILKQNLNFKDYDFAPAYLDDRKEGKILQGNAIFSKYPIFNRRMEYITQPTQESYKEVPENFPILPRVLQHCMLDTPAGEINVFNMHGVWDPDGDGFSPARQRMSDLLLEETSGLQNVILTGDTNAKATNEALRRLNSQLRSVFGYTLKTTFNMRRKDDPGYATAAVDLMYISPNTNVLAAECPDVDISDHLPIVVTLSYN